MRTSARWWKAGLAGRILLAAVAASRLLWPRPSPPPALPPVSREAGVLVNQPVSLARGIYLLGRNTPAAAYAVDASEGIVLIASGIEAAAALVAEQFARLRLDIGRLRALLL